MENFVGINFSWRIGQEEGDISQEVLALPFLAQMV